MSCIQFNVILYYTIEILNKYEQIWLYLQVLIIFHYRRIKFVQALFKIIFCVENKIDVGKIEVGISYTKDIYTKE